MTSSADLVGQLERRDQDDLEVGRLLRLLFERGPGSLHVIHDLVQHDTYEEPEPEYLLSVLGKPAGPSARVVACRAGLLDALRTVAGSYVKTKLCTACGEGKPVTAFRRVSRKAGDGSAGAYRSVCKECRRGQDERLRREGRRA